LIHCRPQTSDGPLKLPILGGVDERVDTAVGERQQSEKLVGPASKVERVAEITDKKQDFNW